eukprot:NODE_19277_length_851_cov_1.866022.p4 GENE.NODE_19277_length_851_cov_1.866022~~NODE_19277_length_851_cov_1.866022.p4  ORF type:complete len:75 (-),score=15.57 NODE_19277_length_851_cov_1.866022:399-623(-)
MLLARCEVLGYDNMGQMMQAMNQETDKHFADAIGQLKEFVEGTNAKAAEVISQGISAMRDGQALHQQQHDHIDQ